VKRNIPIQGSRGEKELNYTTINRGSLPTSIKCDLQTLDSEERIAFGVKSGNQSWKLYTAVDPKLGVQDLIVFKDNSGTTRTADVIRPSADSAGRGTLFKAVVEEAGVEE
jgi:hypothetical protein